MRRLPRVLRLSISAAVLVLLVVAIILLVRVFTGTKAKSIDHITEIAALPQETIIPFNSGYLASNGVRTVCYDGKNKQIWDYMPDTSERNVSASDSLAAFWWGDRVSLLDKDEDILYTNSTGSTVDSVRCGISLAAIYMPEKEQLMVLNSADTKTPVQEIAVSGVTLLDYGFYSDSDMLWTLVLDSSGTVPTTHLTTYQPSKATLTGSFPFSDQVIYKALFTGAKTYAVGTQEIFTIAGGEKAAQTTLVNGWQLMDSARTKDDWRMIFALAGEAVSGQPTRLKLVTGDGTEKEVHLPSGCISAVVTDKKIYGIGTSFVHAIATDGSTTLYQLPAEISRVVTKLSDNRIVVQVGEKLGIITLPS